MSEDGVLTTADTTGPYVSVGRPVAVYYGATKRWHVLIRWVRWNGPNAEDGEVEVVRGSYREAMDAAAEMLDQVLTKSEVE